MGKSPVLGLIRHIAESDGSVQSSDVELLRRFKANGDESAFRALVGRHGAMVFDVCRNVLGHEASAEDAFQATFLVLAQKAGTIRKQASIASWLYGVAYRTACRARANAAKRQKHERAAVGKTLVWPADELSWREVQAVLHEELSQISEGYRAPLVLCYLEGKTQDEAALQLGITKDTVKKRLERGRALLRVRLARRGLGSVAVLLAASWPVAQASAMPGAASITAITQAAVLVGSKQTVAGGLISAEVSALTQGVLKTMLLMKITTIAAGVMVAGVLATGAAALGVQFLPETTAAQQAGESTKKADGNMESPPAAAVSAAAALPPAVRDGLENNARNMAPIALTIEKQRSFPDPQSEGAKKLQGGFPGVLKPCTYEYLAQDGLCYARSNMWVQARSRIGNTEQFSDPYLKPVWQEFSWDGKYAYRGNQSIQPKIIEVVPTEKAETDFLGKVPWYDDDDYFGMIGIAVPRFMRELPRGRQSEILRLLEGDGRVTAVETKRLPGQATDCLVVELRSGPQKHLFWLEPALGHAVRRHEVWTKSGTLALVVDNSDFVKLTDPDLWLPRHCRAEWHYYQWSPGEVNRAPLYVAELRATRLERTGTPSERFSLKYEAGSFVSDARVQGAKKDRDGRVDYRVPENPAEIKGVIQAAKEGREYVPPRSFIALWIVGIGLALLMVSFIIAALSRLRRRHSLKTTPGSNAPQDTSP